MKLTRGLLAGGIALTLALAGCGGKTGGTAEQSSDTGGSGGSGSSLVMFGNVNQLADTVTTQSKTKQSAKLTFDVSAAGQQMTGDGAYRVDGTDIAMQMSLNMPQGTMDMVLVGQVLYIKADAFKSALGAGKEWIKVSPTGTDPVSKALAPMFKQLEESTDVGKSMEKFRAAGTITKSAKDTLDGAEVTHYWLTIDLAKLASVTDDPTTKKALEAQIQQGVKQIESELWLNADNLPVKMTTQVPVPNAGNGTMTMSFKDWGQPVDVTAPPADKVGTLSGR